jgi:DNA transformation protein and related proteins
MSTTQLRNIGPKSAAWLRQVGVRSEQDLIDAGAIGAFLKVRRAGFKPSLNLLYSLEGALLGCHWQELPEPRRAQLLADLEHASAQLPPPRGTQAGSPVTTRYVERDADDAARDHEDHDGGHDAELDAASDHERE